MNVDGIYDLIFYCGIGKDDFEKVSGIIAQRNRKNLILMTSIATYFMVALFVVSFIPESKLAVNRSLYALFTIFIAGLYIPAKYIIKTERQITVWMYVFIVSFYAFGITMNTYLQNDVRAVTIIVLFFAGPVLFTDKPVRMCSMLAVTIVAFLICVISFKDTSVWAADYINGICFGIFSIICSINLANVKAERYLYEIKAEHAYDHDILTGLRNRNSYEINVHSILDECNKAIVFVYFDVNGLHEVNNNEGHRAGDKMLKVCADLIRSVFGSDKSFRIGGDEFLAIAIDKTNAEIDRMLEEIMDGTRRESYHVSTGYAHCYKQGGSVEESVKEAEQYMFINKAAYYSSKGRDRRNR